MLFRHEVADQAHAEGPVRAAARLGHHGAQPRRRRHGAAEHAEARPPAPLTAAASAGPATKAIPALTTGTARPSSAERGVCSTVGLSLTGRVAGWLGPRAAGRAERGSRSGRSKFDPRGVGPGAPHGGAQAPVAARSAPRAETPCAVAAGSTARPETWTTPEPAACPYGSRSCVRPRRSAPARRGPPRSGAAGRPGPAPPRRRRRPGAGPAAARGRRGRLPPRSARLVSVAGAAARAPVRPAPEPPVRNGGGRANHPFRHGAALPAGVPQATRGRGDRMCETARSTNRPCLGLSQPFEGAAPVAAGA